MDRLGLILTSGVVMGDLRVRLTVVFSRLAANPHSQVRTGNPMPGWEDLLGGWVHVSYCKPSLNLEE